MVARSSLGLVVAGPLAAALAGAGGISGGLIGALVGAGIPEQRVWHYEEGIKSGGILMGVKPRSEDDADYIEQSWRNFAGQQINAGQVNAGSRDSTGSSMRS